MKRLPRYKMSKGMFLCPKIKYLGDKIPSKTEEKTAMTNHAQSTHEVLALQTVPLKLNLFWALIVI